MESSTIQKRVVVKFREEPIVIYKEKKQNKEIYRTETQDIKKQS